MNTYELLVADIDGTVVDHGSDGKEIHSQHPSKIAVGNAQKQGKHITFATGRNFEWAESVIAAFGIQSPVIVNNGSRIVDPLTRKPMWENRLEVEIGRKICDFILEHNLAQDSHIGFGHLKEQPLRTFDTHDVDDLIYLDLIGMRESAIDKILELVNGFKQATAAVVPSPQFHGRNNILVTDVKGTKYHAMRELQTLLKVPASQTITIGDGKNDLPLFQASALKIAVDNGAPELKDAADIIVSSVHEHGLAEAIQNYLLPHS